MGTFCRKDRNLELGASQRQVSRIEIYNTYAESWRVLPRESLFNDESNIKFGVPAKPFYASNLTSKQAARARAACRAAGIRNATLLDSCILDTTVLSDEKAVKVFVHLPAPRHVIKPGTKGKNNDHDCHCDGRDDRYAGSASLMGW
jgi:hypothetical protein